MVYAPRLCPHPPFQVGPSPNHAILASLSLEEDGPPAAVWGFPTNQHEIEDIDHVRIVRNPKTGLGLGFGPGRWPGAGLNEKFENTLGGGRCLDPPTQPPLIF